MSVKPVTALEPIADGDLLFRINDGIGIITFNRPESRNALTFDMYDRLNAISDAVSDTVANSGGSSGISALVLHGAGDRAFAAGTDIGEFRNLSTDEQAMAYENQMDKVLDAFEKIPVPTIAAISGACTGGGAAIAGACDLRLCNSYLKYGFPVARTLGNCLSAQNLSRQIWLLGASRVKDLMLSARLMGAEEAQSAGLVTTVTDTPFEDAMEMAESMKLNAPLTMSATKEAMRRLRLASADISDRDLIVQCYTSEDFQEGRDAFLAKRSPQWKGK